MVTFIWDPTYGQCSLTTIHYSNLYSFPIAEGWRGPMSSPQYVCNNLRVDILSTPDFVAFDAPGLYSASATHLVVAGNNMGWFPLNSRVKSCGIPGCVDFWYHF